jgi:predicted DNA-binding protein
MPKKPKAERRVRVALFIEPEQHRKLQALTKATRVPWAVYVREGVDMLLAKYKRKGGGK